MADTMTWFRIMVLSLLASYATMQELQKAHFQIDHEAGQLKIEASKDEADIDFGNDKIDLLLKPGDVKRPAVPIADIFGHDKDKTRDSIHQEPQTKTLNEPDVKNITWKGRINEEKDGGLEADAHVLKTLKVLREMVLTEKERNEPKKSRFHSNDEALDQANSIIDKVEKTHSENSGEYQEEHPDDAKYVEKAKDILKDDNMLFSNDTKIEDSMADDNNATSVDVETTEATNAVSDNKNSTEVDLSSKKHFNQSSEPIVTPKSESSGSTMHSKNESVETTFEQKKHISKFITDTFGFDVTKAAIENSAGNINPNGESVKSPSEDTKTAESSGKSVGENAKLTGENAQSHSETSKNDIETSENAHTIIALKKPEEKAEKSQQSMNVKTDEHNKNRNASITEQRDKKILEEKESTNNASLINISTQNGNVPLNTNSTLDHEDKIADQKVAKALGLSEKEEQLDEASNKIEKIKKAVSRFVESSDPIEANTEKQGKVSGQNEDPNKTNNTDHQNTDKVNTNKTILVDGREGTTTQNINSEKNETLKEGGRKSESKISQNSDQNERNSANLKDNRSTTNATVSDENESLPQKAFTNETEASSIYDIINNTNDKESQSVPLANEEKNKMPEINTDELSIDRELEQVQKASDMLYSQLTKMDPRNPESLEEKAYGSVTNQATANATNDQFASPIHIASAQNFTEGVKDLNNKVSTEEHKTSQKQAKKRTIVAWVPAQIKHHGQQTKKHKRSDILQTRRENKTLNGFLSKFLKHKRSKVRRRKNGKRNSVHQRRTKRRRSKIRHLKSKKRSKVADSEVKNAVATLESLLQEKQRINSQHQKTPGHVLERRNKIRTSYDDQGVFSRPTMSWFKRDFKVTGEDYYPSAQMYKKQVTPVYDQNKIRSQISQTTKAQTRSAFKNPEQLEKELIAKMEKAKRLLKENFVDKKNRTVDEERKVDSMLFNKYKKQNVVLTRKLNHILNDSSAVDNVLNKLDNDDVTKEEKLKKKYKVITTTADDIFAKDKEILEEQLNRANRTAIEDLRRDKSALIADGDGEVGFVGKMNTTYDVEPFARDAAPRSGFVSRNTSQDEDVKSVFKAGSLKNPSGSEEVVNYAKNSTTQPDHASAESELYNMIDLTSTTDSKNTPSPYERSDTTSIEPNLNETADVETDDSIYPESSFKSKSSKIMNEEDSDITRYHQKSSSGDGGKSSMNSNEDKLNAVEHAKAENGNAAIQQKNLDKDNKEESDELKSLAKTKNEDSDSKKDSKTKKEEKNKEQQQKEEDIKKLKDQEESDELKSLAKTKDEDSDFKKDSKTKKEEENKEQQQKEEDIKKQKDQEESDELKSLAKTKDKDSDSDSKPKDEENDLIEKEDNKSGPKKQEKNISKNGDPEDEQPSKENESESTGKENVKKEGKTNQNESESKSQKEDEKDDDEELKKKKLKEANSRVPNVQLVGGNSMGFDLAPKNNSFQNAINNNTKGKADKGKEDKGKNISNDTESGSTKVSDGKDNKEKNEEEQLKEDKIQIKDKEVTDELKSLAKTKDEDSDSKKDSKTKEEDENKIMKEGKEERVELGSTDGEKNKAEKILKDEEERHEDKLQRGEKEKQKEENVRKEEEGTHTQKDEKEELKKLPKDVDKNIQNEQGENEEKMLKDDAEDRQQQKQVQEDSKEQNKNNQSKESKIKMTDADDDASSDQKYNDYQSNGPPMQSPKSSDSQPADRKKEKEEKEEKLPQKDKDAGKGNTSQKEENQMEDSNMKSKETENKLDQSYNDFQINGPMSPKTEPKESLDAADLQPNGASVESRNDFKEPVGGMGISQTRLIEKADELDEEKMAKKLAKDKEKNPTSSELKEDAKDKKAPEDDGDKDDAPKSKDPKDDGDKKLTEGDTEDKNNKEKLAVAKNDGDNQKEKNKSESVEESMEKTKENTKPLSTMEKLFEKALKQKKKEREKLKNDKLKSNEKTTAKNATDSKETYELVDVGKGQTSQLGAVDGPSSTNQNRGSDKATNEMKASSGLANQNEGEDVYSTMSALAKQKTTESSKMTEGKMVNNEKAVSGKTSIQNQAVLANQNNMTLNTLSNQMINQTELTNQNAFIEGFRQSSKVKENDNFVTRLGKDPPLITFREDRTKNQSLKHVVKELRESLGVIDNLQTGMSNDSTTVHHVGETKHDVANSNTNKEESATDQKIKDIKTLQAKALKNKENAKALFKAYKVLKAYKGLLQNMKNKNKTGNMLKTLSKYAEGGTQYMDDKIKEKATAHALADTTNKEVAAEEIKKLKNNDEKEKDISSKGINEYLKKTDEEFAKKMENDGSRRRNEKPTPDASQQQGSETAPQATKEKAVSTDSSTKKDEEADREKERFRLAQIKLQNQRKEQATVIEGDKQMQNEAKDSAKQSTEQTPVKQAESQLEKPSDVAGNPAKQSTDQKLGQPMKQVESQLEKPADVDRNPAKQSIDQKSGQSVNQQLNGYTNTQSTESKSLKLKEETEPPSADAFTKQVKILREMKEELEDVQQKSKHGRASGNTESTSGGVSESAKSTSGGGSESAKSIKGGDDKKTNKGEPAYDPYNNFRRSQLVSVIAKKRRRRHKHKNIPVVPQ